MCGGFVKLIIDRVEKKQVHGVVVAKGAQEISHLFFVDDSLIFSRATMEEVDVVTQAIQVYEHDSGQLVNMDKSEVTYSQNVHEDMKNMI